MRGKGNGEQRSWGLGNVNYGFLFLSNFSFRVLKQELFNGRSESGFGGVSLQFLCLQQILFSFLCSACYKDRWLDAEIARQRKNTSTKRIANGTHAGRGHQASKQQSLAHSLFFFLTRYDLFHSSFFLSFLMRIPYPCCKLFRHSFHHLPSSMSHC